VRVAVAVVPNDRGALVDPKERRPAVSVQNELIWVELDGQNRMGALNRHAQEAA
jgi:hypothetical protein